MRTFVSRPSHRPASLWRRLGLTALAAAALTACNSSNDEDAVAAPVVVSGVVADGPLSGAIVCYDLNDNAECDVGEPTGNTDADGKYRFELTKEQADAEVSHAIVAQVPASAIDKDTGQAVGVAFTLRAPVTDSNTVFVSPLTTLVVELSASQGLSTAEAVASVQGQLGLTASPLANFVAAADTDAATKARTVNTVITEVAKLADAAQATPAQRQALINSVVASDLSTLAARVASSIANTPAAVAAHVSAAMLEERNLTAATVVQQAQAAAVLAAPMVADAPGPFVSVRRFTYADANNHFVVAFLGDSSALSNGEFLVSESRINQANGAAVAFNRNTAYWNKASQAWEVCPIGYQIIRVKPQTATLPQDSTFCGGSRTLSRIATVDVAGRRMADVVAEVRAGSLRDVPGADTDATGLPVKWGAEPALLGEAVFPAGAKMHPREQTSEVGDTDRYSLTDLVRVVPVSGSGTFRQAVVLEDAKRMTGNLVNTAAVVTNSNTVFLDELPLDQADPLLRDVIRYRVAFNGDAVRYYACNVVDASNNSQGCVALGEGSSVMETRADSRVLRFATGYPVALTATVKRQRLLVERSGGVFGGYRDLERKYHNTRPNTVAWEALRGALSITPPAAPVPPAGPGPFTTLRNFTFTDAANYSYRAFSGDNSVVDNLGYYLADEIREQRSAGNLVPFARNALYWTGASWFDCGNSGEGVLRANGKAPFDSRYCGSFDDERYNSVTVTLNGQRMSDVVNNIRFFSSKDGNLDHVGWGPNPSVHTQLASAFFPAGSTMEYRGNLRKATPVTLHTAPGDQVRVPPADTSVPFNSWPFAANLEEFIAKNPGDINAGPLNGSTAFFVTSITLPSATGGFTNQLQWRVAFDANGQKARFYNNNVSASTGFTTNYVKLLDTTYTVETIGGKRVLKFAAMPEGFEVERDFQRMYAEHNGGVWYASKSATPTTPGYSVRMNRIAGQALHQALGID